MESVMLEYRRLVVQGLFGSVDHDIILNQDPRITILAGPNGCGKTHVLKLYRAVLGLDIPVLISSPYRSISVFLSDDSEFKVGRSEESELIRLNFEGVAAGNLERSNFYFDSTGAREDSVEEDLPTHIRQIVDGRWMDTRTNRILSQKFLEHRYGYRVSTEYLRRKMLSEHPWLTSFIPEVAPVLIDTKRLDTSLYSSDPLGTEVSAMVKDSPRSAVGRIGEYIDKVKREIDEAQNDSLRRSQQADEKFVSTLLKRSKAPISEGSLRARYQKLAAIHAELSENGLTGKAVTVQIPSDTDPTERRILKMFMDDWEKKLGPLIPVNDKLKLLRRIINEKFIRKSLTFDDRGYMKFLSDDGVTVSVDQLSSGEQHLLALFAMLIFSAHPGSIVLIDEPEISLHAAWKHDFVHDLEQVAELSKLAVVAATHSSAIINGKWDLVRELGLSS